jgi:hypothetical protein
MTIIIALTILDHPWSSSLIIVVIIVVTVIIIIIIVITPHHRAVKKRSKIMEIVAAKDVIFALAASGVCVAYARGAKSEEHATNHRVAVLPCHAMPHDPMMGKRAYELVEHSGEGSILF